MQVELIDFFANILQTNSANVNTTKSFNLAGKYPDFISFMKLFLDISSPSLRNLWLCMDDIRFIFNFAKF